MGVGSFSRILSVILFLCLGACTTTKPDKLTCGERDWYEAGRRDGSQGATLDRLSQYKRECAGEFNGFWETMYTNGRNAGLVEFCAPDNAYELGRMGIAYMYVCPSTVEPDFLAGYRRGQDARKLEIENQKLDAEIDNVSAKLNQSETDYQRRELASELEELKKTRAQNEKDLTKISK